MQKFQIAVCDDQEIFRQTITSHLDSYMIENDIHIPYKEFSSGKELINAYRNGDDFQIVFLDIKMNGISGLETAQKIKSIYSHHVYFIMVSSYSEYMQKSFEVHPFYYLVKPVSRDDVYNLIDEITDLMQDYDQGYTLLQCNNEVQVINLNDICYIDVQKGKKSILRFHFSDYILETKGTLSQWSEKLQDMNFYPCYRGVLVNMLHISRLEPGKILMDCGDTIPVSRRTEQAFVKEFVNRVMKTRH